MYVCRRYVEEEHLDENLRKHLPRDEGKAVEKPAEAALRTKMCDPRGFPQRWFFAFP